MPAAPPTPPPRGDPEDLDPRERGLKRRSGDPSILPWLIVGGLGLLAVAAYAISALVGP